MKVCVIVEHDFESTTTLAVRATEEAAKNLVAELTKEWQKWYGPWEVQTILDVYGGPGYDYQVVDMDEEDSVVLEREFRIDRKKAEKKRKTDLQGGD